MKNLPFKSNSLFTDKKNRILFHDHEVFTSIFFVLKQSKFSSNFLPFRFKCNISRSFFSLLRERCLYSGYNRTVSTKIKLSRFIFIRKTLQGVNCGFYRSVW